MNTLQGKTAIVTGAASGIGRASAMLFAAEGAAVVALDRAAEVEATATAIRAAGGRAVALIKDSSSEPDVAGAVATALKEFGSLDACYANAGISGGLVPFFEETVEHWMEVLKINLIGTFLLAKYAAKEMVKQKRGSIICTASVAAFEGQIGQAAYASSKGGVVALVMPAAREFAQFGVRVNAIAPGIFLTPMLLGLSQEAQDSLASSLPFPKKLGDPSQYAALVRHMIENSYLNGEVVRLDAALRMAPR